MLELSYIIQFVFIVILYAAFLYEYIYDLLYDYLALLKIQFLAVLKVFKPPLSDLNCDFSDVTYSGAAKLVKQDPLCILR